MKATLCCAIVLAWVAAARLFAATPITPTEVGTNATKIGFETDPHGNPVSLGTLAGTIWSSEGVTFDGNDVVGDPVGGAFTITSPPNVLSGDTTNAFQPIHATFSPPVSLVGAWGFDFVLEVFDQQGHSLGSNTYTDGSPGIFGGANEYGFLGFSSDVPIATAVFSRAYPTNPVYGFHIDDLVFLPVPEPSTLTLASVATLALMIPLLRRRSGRTARYQSVSTRH